MQNNELASLLLAIRTKMAQTDRKFDGRGASVKQLRRLYVFMHYRLAQSKLKKVMLQMITGEALLNEAGNISGSLLSMWKASTLITELEVKDGYVGRMLLAECETRLDESPTLTPWRVFDAQWIETNLRDLPEADTGQQL